MSKPKESERRRSQSSQSATVFSYHQNRSASDAQRARYDPPAASRTGLDRLKHIPTMLAVVVIVGCLLYASVLDSTPRVSIAVSENGKTLQRPADTYSNYISSQLDGSIFNKSKLTFNSQSLTAALTGHFPEIDSAVVTLPLLGHKPVVRLAITSPAFVLASQSGAYYISSQGVPLVKVSEVADSVTDLATISDQTNLPITVGTQVLPEATVTFIREVIQQLEATETSFESVVLPVEANEIQVRPTGKPYVIRFNSLEDARTQVGTYRAVQQRLEGSGVAPAEYIDVRVAERAYYK